MRVGDVDDDSSADIRVCRWKVNIEDETKLVGLKVCSGHLSGRERKHSSSLSLSLSLCKRGLEKDAETNR